MLRGARRRGPVQTITLGLIVLGVVGTALSVLLLTAPIRIVHVTGVILLFLLVFLVLPLGILLVSLLGLTQAVRTRRYRRHGGAAPAGSASLAGLFLWLALMLMWLLLAFSVIVALAGLNGSR